MPTDPTPAPAEMFAMTFAGALGAYTCCLMCGALIADGGKDLHHAWHEALAEPPVPRRVPTQAERIAAARADGHHRITEGRQTATDAMSDRYGEALDLIATAVQTATDDTLRDSIRSMIRRVRPEAFDLWSPTPTHRPTTTEETPT